MKAVRFSEYGGPEVLTVEEVEEPHAAVGDEVFGTCVGGGSAEFAVLEHYASKLLLTTPALEHG